MSFIESETVELKSVVVDDIKKEIVAFANSNGGTLYIGVQNDGSVVGVENPDSVALQISNMVRDAIKPDVTLFVAYKTIVAEGKQIVEVTVQKGTDRPYYIAKKGMRPEGVYVRQGYSAVPASDSAIRRMIKETDGDHYESMRSLNQNLTFDVVKQEFKHRNIEFGHQQMRTMGLIDSDGLYSNLALLLSDQNPHTIKAAVFQDRTEKVFKNRQEFGGSLFKQLHDVYNYIDFYNQTRSTFNQLSRIDERDYPLAAIRESLLNLIVHQDYSISASALISIYSDRIELLSIGGLVPDIELDDIFLGMSVCRNQQLANVFYRLELIEAYGTGIKKIMEAYDGFAFQPTIVTTKNAFKITLPNVNMDAQEEVHFETKLYNPTSGDEKANNRMQEVAFFIQEHHAVTRAEVEELLGISSSTAYRLLKEMVSSGIIKREGVTNGTKYVLP